MTVFWFWTCSMTQCRAILSTSWSLGRYLDLQAFLSYATPAWTLISRRRLKFDWILRLVKTHRLRRCPLAAWSANMPLPPVIWSPFKWLNIRTRFYWISFSYTSVSSIVPSHSQSVSWFGICILLGIGIDWSWKAPQFLPSENDVMAMVTSLSYQIDLLSGIFPCFWILWWFLALIYFMVISLPLSHV